MTGTDPTDEATKRFEDLFRPPLDLFFKGGDFNDVSAINASIRLSLKALISIFFRQKK